MQRSVPGNPTLVVAMIPLILLPGIYTHPTIPSCIATHVVHRTPNPPSCALCLCGCCPCGTTPTQAQSVLGYKQWGAPAP